MAYGIFDAPENVRRTRNNKEFIGSDCDHIIVLAEQFRETARRCPELDDSHHAELVEKIAEDIHAALMHLQLALETEYGR